MVPDLHPLVSGFSPDAYDRGRPGYDPEVVAAIAEELGLTAGTRVLDLAAGTGLLSRELADMGAEVVGVEPLADMRERLAEAIGPERALAGAAEAIPLPAAAVDAVTVADAFHWFDQMAAIEEIRRVLRPRGAVGIVWSFPSWRRGDGWPAELGEMLAAHVGTHPRGGPRQPEEAFADAGGFEPVRRREIVVDREYSRDDVVAYVASISWIGVLPEAEQRAVLEEVEALLMRHGVERDPGAVTTVMHVTRLIEPGPGQRPGPAAAAS